MAPETAPDSTKTAVSPNTIELRLTGGMFALNRLLTVFQSKRMPVAGFTVGWEGDAMRATILLDCPPETARRYTMLLSGMEDVQNAEPVDKSIEVALLKTSGDGWKESAARHGIEAHESGDTVVASGEPEKIEGWLPEIEVEDLVRLGPVARPGNGGV